MTARTETIIDEIPFHPDRDGILTALHIRPESAPAQELAPLFEEAQEIARPKAIFREAYIEARGPDFVVLDSVRFSSRIMAVNLQETHRAFPFVATCGEELDRWASRYEDLLVRFVADQILVAALRAAHKALEDRINAAYELGHSAVMNPGSLEDWPITEQEPLFSFFHKPLAIGVTLTPSLLMVPTKSVSGLRFPLETSYENCQLCPREICPGRRAPYNPGLYAARYQG